MALLESCSIDSYSQTGFTCWWNDTVGGNGPESVFCSQNSASSGSMCSQKLAESLSVCLWADVCTIQQITHPISSLSLSYTHTASLHCQCPQMCVCVCVCLCLQLLRDLCVFFQPHSPKQPTTQCLYFVESTPDLGLCIVRKLGVCVYGYGLLACPV